MPEGRILKGIAGFYTVLGEDGTLLEATARGRLRLEHDLLIGDKVFYQMMDEKSCSIEKVLPRYSVMKRPYIANVDQILLVFALKDPDYSTYLIDRFLVLAEASRIPVVLVFNKADKVRPADARRMASVYQQLGYPVRISSTMTRQGKNLLRGDLKERISVLAGPSGVGKSAILNMLCPGHELQTGEVSQRIGRGRHTTRQVQLLPLAKGGFVADTPGFTQIDLDFITSEELPEFFPEFQTDEECRYRGCIHMAEPGCVIKSQVDEGEIPLFRYEHYKEFQQEVRRFQENRYR